jgi:hypothetical protein
MLTQQPLVLMSLNSVKKMSGGCGQKHPEGADRNARRVRTKHGYAI